MQFALRARYCVVLTVFAVTVMAPTGGALAQISSAQATSSNASANESANDSANDSAHSGFTGFWRLRYDGRNVPEAQLLARISASQQLAHLKQDREAIRWCQQVGVPALMESSAPLDLLVGKSQIAIVSQIPSLVRRIYLDRQTHPDAATYDATRNGDSIGHWQGDALIVDTTGFSNGGVTSLPGGGYRSSSSHLRERYELKEDGAVLEVTFSWEDPAVFARPHSYAFRYSRVARSYDATEYFCDSSDGERGAFLTDPVRGVD